MGQISTRFGFFLFPLILILGFNTMVVFFLVKDLGVNDNYLKNGGSIRAGIQRTAKLLLAGKDYSESVVLVNKRFSQILEDQDGFNLYQKPRDEYLKNILAVQKKWEALLADPRPEEAFRISEEVWLLDQSVAEFTEALTARKKVIFGFLFLTLGSNFLITMYVFYLNIRLVRNYLEPAAHHDALTRILSRRSFEEQLRRHCFRAGRSGRPLSLVMFDIDFFKSVNDSLGHEAGDRVLTGLVEIVKNQIRRHDIFARLGGEEFCVLVPDGDLAASTELAEKIRRAVFEHNFASPPRITVSLGVAELQKNETPADLVRRTDEAMYRSKKSGRNQVQISGG